MNIDEVRRIIHTGNVLEKNNLRDYFKKYGNTFEKEEEVHEILVELLLKLDSEEIINLSGIIGYPVFLRICLMPKIRHKFPLLQDGASLIILDEYNDILVQQRMDNGKYGFSGGCQELGEELVDVAIRECMEETGLTLDKDKIIDVCEVSGLSRKNSYPNGDVVVNNTALYFGYLKDCTGSLRKDFESKQIFFKPLEFLENLDDSLKHEKDFIMICRMYLDGKVPSIVQEKLPELFVLPNENFEFDEYVASLNTEEIMALAKQMGYQKFLLSCIDERIKKIFPYLLDKSILINLKDEKILVEKVSSGYALPKRIQSVGESFIDVLSSSFNIDINNLELVTRVSFKDNNIFINGMVYETSLILEENNSLRYFDVSKVFDLLSLEDQKYLMAYQAKKEK